MDEMCGTCGVCNQQSGELVTPNLVERMMRLLEHRGPDDQGVYLSREVGLGHRSSSAGRSTKNTR